MKIYFFLPPPIGQTESIYLKTKTKMTGNFQLVERRVLNTPARPCQEAGSYSFTRCLLEFVARSVGCHLHLGRTQKLPKYPPCRSLGDIERYINLLEKLKDYSWLRLTRETGCSGKCHIKEYRFNKVKQHVNVEGTICLFSWERNQSPGMSTIPPPSS